ncbi:alkaline ceramidase ydc1 [Coemansia sp. RSA 1813]|nr:alkaline ceramidase ydc1 [Coemansia sp. RSA 1843]KAJ2085662.1 alkaline ceramidase ydc1 [Coemansia sp. RSA 986]KAJ2210588.1 alkaline ceramidase ydc1 [Coemansia sp. RSA 487]KAJ2563121.1 alkaline ceramidase ydc1 [Coemansia sp. RSA 1813]
MGMILEDNIRDPHSYFWGERTSTLDWCEENYAVSNYIAEFWNVMTNVTMTAIALLGVYNSIKYNQGKRVTAIYLAMLLVGTGSVCFHATLKYSTQLLDELPMLYVCTIAFYSLLEIEKKIRHGWKLPVTLAVFQTFITLTYMFWLQSPVFHQVVFAVSAFGAGLFAYKRLNDPRVNSDARRLLVRLFMLGHICMLSGFFVWNLDNIFCDQLRSYRSYVGMPLDVVLQLHGWWHILTGYGCGYMLLLVHYVKLAYIGHSHLFTVKYFLGIFPHITLREPKKLD